MNEARSRNKLLVQNYFKHLASIVLLVEKSVKMATFGNTLNVVSIASDLDRVLFMEYHDNKKPTIIETKQIKNKINDSPNIFILLLLVLFLFSISLLN